MAKNNNLKNFLADVADAIREKKGTADKINPQDFSDEIRGIESGGEAAVFAEDMVDNNGGGSKSIKNIVISDGVTDITRGAYSAFSSLMSISIPNSVVYIGVQAFQNCYSIETVTIPPLVTLLNDSVFMNCNNMRSVNIPDGVTYIGATAFSNCRSITSVMLMPIGDLTIKNSAFSNCSKVPYFDFRRSSAIPILEGSSVFSGSSCQIVVPDNLYDQWIVATNWSAYASRIVKASEFIEPTNE